VIRLLLLSDTHGQLDPRIARLAAEVEICVHAGDIGDASVLRELAVCPRLVAVRGNNDIPLTWPAEEHPLLEQLPNEARIELPGGTLVVLHGHRVNPATERHQRLRHHFHEARAVLYGHSHRMVTDTGGLPWILNPGAAGRTRTYGGPCCLLLSTSEQRWQVQVRRFRL